MSSIYETVKIKEGQIRLLQIVSTVPHIVCNLRAADLDNGITFDALSYVWGDPDVTTDIFVNGARVSVTKNLSTALEYASKHLQPGNQDLWVWADAVCINQTDIPEKNQQVPLMRNIYAQAGTVFCWLGPPQKDIFDAMDWIETVAHECKMGELSDEEQTILTRFEDARYAIASNMKALLSAFKLCEEKTESIPNIPVFLLKELHGFISADPLLNAIGDADRLIVYLLRTLSSEPTSLAGWLNIVSMKSLIPPLRDISRDLEKVKFGSKTCTGGNLPTGSGLDNPELAERAQELAVMGKSYRIMGQVLLKATSELDLKMEDLRALVQKIEHEHLIGWCQNHPGLFSKGASIDSCEQSGWYQIWNLFFSPYWQRVWIFQEVVLSRKPLFACGNRSITMDSLSVLNNWLAHLGKPTIRKPDFIPDLDWIIVRRLFTRWFMAISHMINARKAHFPLNSNMEFDWSVSAGLCATDPRDHIYGLLGLSHLNITPNYSQDTSVTETCVNFFVEYLRGHRDGSRRNAMTMGELAMLRFAGIGHNWSSFPGLPSWAPNFAGISHTEEPDSPVWIRNDEDFESGIFKSSHSAQIEGYKMHVAAIMLDVVERTGPLLEDYVSASGLSASGAPISWTLNLAMEFPQYVLGGHPLIAIYCALHYKKWATDIRSNHRTLSEINRVSLREAMKFIAFLRYCCYRVNGEHVVCIRLSTLVRWALYLDPLLEMKKVGETAISVDAVLNKQADKQLKDRQSFSN